MSISAFVYRRIGKEEENVLLGRELNFLWDSSVHKRGKQRFDLSLL